jgi:hypothetical protein
MSTLSCPSIDQLTAWISGGESPAPGAAWEDHLSRCAGCRAIIDEAISVESESFLISSLAAWQEEQETFLPTLRTILASSFRARGPLQLEDFSFIESVVGDRVTGRLGKLELHELIGIGSMGAVFRARDASLEREVAVKVLRPEYAGSEEIARLFLDEARAAAALQHENVLPIYDVARDPGEGSYYVMPLVEGGRLADLIRERGGLSDESFYEIAMKMTRALAAAHAAGIVHRDVKPANILLEGKGRPGVWLADFGLARAAQHGFGEGSLVGTPGYVAPEVEKGGSGTVAADLYSLGAVFAEMWVGRLPRRGEAMRDFWKSAAKPAPDWLEALVGRLLSPDPASRPGSAEEVVEQLEKGISGERIALEKAEKAARQRRHRRAAMMVMSGIAGVVLLADLASGHRTLNYLLRHFSSKAVSVDGRPGVYATVADALDGRAGDLVVRISDPGRLFSGGGLRIEGRSITLIGEGARGDYPARARGPQEVIEVIDGEFHLRDLDLRFRTAGNQSHEGLVEVTDATVTLERSTIRQSVGSSRNSAAGGALFLLRGNSHLEVREGNLITDRNGKGVVVAGSGDSRKTVRLEEARFAGGNLFQIVSSDGADGGVFEADVVRCDIIATNPIRFGRNGAKMKTGIRSIKNLWQCTDVFLSSRDEEAAELHRHFRLDDDDSLIAAGGDRAVEIGAKPAEGTRQGRGDGAAAGADWATFWSDPSQAGLSGGDVGNTKWVDWIVVFHPGRPPVWNEELPPGDRGAMRRSEEMEVFD